jgi:hypothetical protein
MLYYSIKPLLSQTHEQQLEANSLYNRRNRIPNQSPIKRGAPTS